MRHGTSSPVRVLALTGVAFAIAGVPATASFAGPRQEAKPIEVVGTATNKFDPADVTATPDADGNITVTLKSEPGAPHTWENKELGINSGNVNGGEEKTFTFKAPPAGTHKVICLYHEGVGMVGNLIVEGAGGKGGEKSPSAAPSSQPPASASASASVGTGGGHSAPTAGPGEHGEDAHGEGEHVIPGVAGNPMLERIEAERAAQQDAVSGFKFFTFVCVAFLFILGAAILFSTRSRRQATTR